MATALRRCGPLPKSASDLLEPIFCWVAGPSGRSLVERLEAYALDFGAAPWLTTGLNFSGTSEFSVVDIDAQRALAALAQSALEQFERTEAAEGAGPMERVEFVRAIARRDPKLGEFLMRPNRRRLAFADWTDRTDADGFWALMKSSEARRAMLGVAAASIGIGVLIYLALWRGASPFAWRLAILHGSLALGAGVGATALIAVLFAAAFLATLRFHESRDVPDDRNPALDAVKAIAARENRPGFSQNHITAITPLKPGWFRKLTLAIALLGIRLTVTYWFRPGFVVTMGTIHYAKWFRPRGSDKMVFLSNYDGSWESYLEDFITKAHWGQSAVWSNGQGFPRTKYLAFGGAQDGDRFKRWVRRQQVPTQCWFSRFPDLAADQIRSNALIHSGLMRVSNDTDAKAWLDLFGSRLLPGGALEADEIQSLVFRGLRDLPFAVLAVVRLPDSHDVKTKWLSRVQAQVSFGDRPFGGSDSTDQMAAFFAVSAAGLARLGLPEDALSTFPAPFSLGMANRADVLKDVGASEPSRWEWADSDRPISADAIVLFFCKNREACGRALEEHKTALGADAILYEVWTQPTSKGLDFEHFGFRDGISQPVIRGTQRATRGSPERDLIEPGEFVLGYPNNEGFFPPTPIVSALADPYRRLPNEPADLPANFPNFGSEENLQTRDFGRNGTFIAVRQLQQDVDGFNASVVNHAEELACYPALPSIVGRPINGDWVAAKMLGRWRDGTPLIHSPGDPQRDRTRDNDFDYGSDDPQGLQCPLGAHTRRANPRTSLLPGDPQQQAITNRHRIIRRGRSYERDGEKGLLFIALCADLERQFEFVQQTWIASQHFHGLHNESDPIASSPVHPDHSFKRNFTIPTFEAPVILKGIEGFVTARGGGYFFLPSKSSIRFLVDCCQAASRAAP